MSFYQFSDHSSWLNNGHFKQCLQVVGQLNVVGAWTVAGCFCFCFFFWLKYFLILLLWGSVYLPAHLSVTLFLWAICILLSFPS